MIIKKNEIETLHSEVLLTIQPEDYLPNLNSKLKEKRKTVEIKGFRKGKTPLSLLKKMIGNQIMADILNEKIGKELSSFLEKENIEILGEPLPLERIEPVDIDITLEKDYEFGFEIGEKPELDIYEISETDTFPKNNVTIADEMIEEELTGLRKRAGKMEEVADKIDESDYLELEAKEMAGKKIKENGWETQFSVLIEQIADDKLKKEILKMRKGDSVVFDIYKLEKDRDKDFVDKHLLKIENEDDENIEIGNMFSGSIAKITRWIPAEITEDFLKQSFGPDIKTKEEAEKKIREELQNSLDTQANNYITNLIADKIMEETKVEFPQEFLKKWFKTMEQYKKMDDAEFDKTYPTLLKDMKWYLISSALVEKNDIEVSEEEIDQQLSQNAFRLMNMYSQGQTSDSYETYKNIINYMKSDQKEVAKTKNEIGVTKLLNSFLEKITKEEKEIDFETFKDIITEYNTKNKSEE